MVLGIGRIFNGIRQLTKTCPWQKPNARPELRLEAVSSRPWLGPFMARRHLLNIELYIVHFDFNATPVSSLKKARYIEHICRVQIYRSDLRAISLILRLMRAKGTLANLSQKTLD